MDPSPPVIGLCCTNCGCALELPADLTAIFINCPQCAADNVLAPELIQARQRQHDLQFLAVERAQQQEQQRLAQQRVLAMRRAASRRNTVLALTIVGVFLVLPALVVGGLVVLGVNLGKKAISSLEAVQDPQKNGVPAIASEIRKKLSEGCSRVLVAPQIRMGSDGTVRLPLQATGHCVHLIAATAAPGAAITLEQVTRHPLSADLPASSPALDYRLCASATAEYEFSIRSDASAPFTYAAIACSRTRAEGLVRSELKDPETTGLADLRSWAKEYRAKGCSSNSAEPTVVQGAQSLDVDSRRGGPCFNLLLSSHFNDALLAVTLTSPDGKRMAAPAPATRVHLEYCPNQTGRHQIDIQPSTQDHFAMLTLDCPRLARSSSMNSARKSTQLLAR